MLKLKLQSFGHLMRRADSFEKTLMLGKIEGRRRGRQRMRWLDGITDIMHMSLSLGVGDGQGGLVCCCPRGRKESDMTERLKWTEEVAPFHCLPFNTPASRYPFPPVTFLMPPSITYKSSTSGCREALYELLLQSRLHEIFPPSSFPIIHPILLYIRLSSTVGIVFCYTTFPHIPCLHD